MGNNGTVLITMAGCRVIKAHYFSQTSSVSWNALIKALKTKRETFKSLGIAKDRMHLLTMCFFIDILLFSAVKVHK